MNHKPQSRKDKIQLLKDLSEGKKTLSDLQPEKVEMWLKKGGKYYEPFKQLELTKDEFEVHKENAKNTTMLIPDERFEYD